MPTIPARPRAKEESIETLRGVAILLIVVFHCIPEVVAPTGDFGYDYVAYSFRLIRVPLFTAIAGYIYAMRPLGAGGAGAFAAGKARRLLLPWLSVTLLTVVLQGLANSADRLSPAHLFGALWLPIGHLWFLPAMWWVFLTIAVLESYRCLATYAGWLAGCAVAWIFAIFLQGLVAPLAVSGYLVILPFFLFGMGARRFPERVLARGAMAPYAVLAVIGLGIHQMMWFGAVTLTSIEYNLLVLVTVYATQGLIFRFRRGQNLLARLGHYSFPIYLFHVIAISIASRIARAADITNGHALFALKLALALSLSLLIALAVPRFPVLRLLLLGERGAR